MGRTYDKAGYTDWVNKLKYGMSRDEVFAGFANSAEFDKICKQYGISRGTYKATNIGNYKPFVAEYYRLDELNSLSTKPKTTKSLTDQYNNVYDFAYTNNYGYSGNAGSFSYEYLTNSKYNKLKGVLYIPKGESSNKTTNLKIYGGDSKGRLFLLYTSPIMKKTSKAVSFDVNVTGWEKVYIQWGANAGYSNVSNLNCCLGNCYFYTTENSKKQDRKTLPIPLTTINGIASNPSACYIGFQDVYDNEYGLGLFNNNNNQSNPIYYEYLLNSEYKKFNCTICPIKGSSYNGSYKVYIYKDDKLAYTSPEMSKNSKPVKVSIDLTGCNDFQIKFSNYYSPGWETGRKGLAISNPYLYIK